MKQKQLKFLLFINLFSLVGYYTFAPLYALFAHSFGLTPKAISFIWSGYSLITALFILLFGKFENRKKKGRMVVFGYFIYAIGAFSFLLVHSKKALIIVLLISRMYEAYSPLFTRLIKYAIYLYIKQI